MSKFVKSSFWMVMSSVVIRAFSFITLPFLARYFLKSDIAIFKSAQSFTIILLTALPIGSAILYNSSKENERAGLYPLLFYITSGATVLLSLAVSIFPPIRNLFIPFGDEISNWLLLIPTMIVLLCGFKAILITWLSSEMAFKEISTACISKLVVLYALIIAFSFINPSLVTLLNLIMVTETIETILLWKSFKSHKGKLLPVSFGQWGKKSINYIGIYGLDQILNVFATQYPVIFTIQVMGASLAPEMQLPLNAVAVPISLVTISISKVLLPYISLLKNDQEIGKKLEQISHLTTLVTLPILVYISLFACQISDALFGKNWSNAIIALRLLPFGMVMSVFNMPFTALAPIKNRPLVSLSYSTCLFVFRLCALYYGFHTFGFLGACWFYVISDTVLRAGRLLIDMRMIKMPVSLLWGGVKVNLITSSVLYLVALILERYMNLYLAVSLATLTFILLNTVWQKERLYKSYLQLSASLR